MSTSRETSFDVEDWGGYAACYDALNELTPYQELQRRVAAELGSLDGQRVLDAACGTGNLTRILLWQGRGEIWGVDFSEEMLQRARQKCTGERVHFAWGDLNQPLQFEDGFFDQVVSINTLYALNHPAALLAEFARILKPGGKLILVTPKKGYENGLILKEHCQSQKPDEYWRDAHSSPEREWMLICEAIQEPSLRHQMMAVAEYNRKIGATTPFHFFDIAELSAIYEECGLTILKTGLTYAQQGLLLLAQKGEIT